jgi:hypothetical protein
VHQVGHYPELRQDAVRSTKHKKTTASFVMYVCLSARMEQLGCHWTDIQEIWFDYFSKIYRENSRLITI